MNIRYINILYLLLLASIILSCKKDKLEGETEFLIGTWKYRQCDNEEWEETLTPDTEKSNYRMTFTKAYRIDWYNPYTGSWIATKYRSSSMLGKLEMDFPGTLTGTESLPIMLFKVYPAGGTFLAPIIPDGGSEEFTHSMLPDTTIKSVGLTDWNTVNNQFNISISPNPTSSHIEIVIHGDAPIGEKWYFVDGNGANLIGNTVKSSKFELDLSVYPAGVYYFVIQTESEKKLTQIIKQ